MKNINHTFVVLAYKESEHLEECIKSVLSQTLKTNVVIATSTPNNHINKLALKYKLKIIVNKESKGIATDFNFAFNCVESELVTIAHQDDIYENNYAKEIIKTYIKNKNSSIIFTNYFELRNNEKVYKNKNLNIKKILLFPLRLKLGKYKFFRRLILSFGNPIGCPAVTFVKNNTPDDIFLCDFRCNVDWYTWEKLSNLNSSFVYISKPLMGHRIHSDSTTTEIINESIRTKEDYIMFQKFWPKSISTIINKYYVNSEKNNKL